MKTGLLSLLTGTALMAAATISQAEGVLDNSQLDRVVAGDTVQIAATSAAGITTASGAASTSTANNTQAASTSGGGHNGALSMGVAAPVLGASTYTIVHTAP